MPKYIRTLTIIYDTEISNKEIPLFRGAVLKSLGDKANVLYHNHTGDDTFRYSYPLIQYKRLNGMAAIVCVEEGADVIGQFLTNAFGKLKLGEREVTCNVQRVKPAKILVQSWQHLFPYHLHGWLPLNRRNYQLYVKADNAEDRKVLLTNILIGNLLSMLKGLGICLENQLLVELTKLSDSYIIYNKGIALMAFNVDFKCNLSIPNYLGIGKNASIGYGVVHQKYEDKEKAQEDGKL